MIDLDNEVSNVGMVYVKLDIDVNYFALTRGIEGYLRIDCIVI